MITKYKADFEYGERVTCERCVRETEKSVFVEVVGFHSGRTFVRREAKECGSHAYFDNWDDAKARIVEHAKGEAERAEARLQRLMSRLEHAKALTRENKG